MSKKIALLTALAGAMMDGAMPDLGSYPRRPAKKSPLTNKQKKARNKSKRAKKARK